MPTIKPSKDVQPLSAFRAMSAAALRVFQVIRKEGTQRGVLASMQTREELYRQLDYERLEHEMETLQKDTPPDQP